MIHTILASLIRFYCSFSLRNRRIGLAVLAVLCATLLCSNHSSAAIASVKSGAGNYCIDLEHNRVADGTRINNRGCNQNEAQAWDVRHDSLVHDGNYCLSVAGDSKAKRSGIVLSKCSDAPGQVWLQYKKGLINPNSGMCLTIPDEKTSAQLVIDDCDVDTKTKQQWVASGLSPAALAHQCSQLKNGERVACYAEVEWSNWQNSPDHKDLLDKYTVYSPTESWCADFVSYVYMQAGQPFTGGDVVPWDVAAAYQVKTQDFTMHDPENYTPKVGDVAVFNYSGGHTEIVIRGGAHPTFLYGNSGTIDPTTDNGQMAANTITSEEPNGQLIYYLSKD